jgi:hypothetical protein
VIDAAPLATVKVKVAVEVPAVLVALMVSVVALSAADGVPVISPLLVLKVRPAGGAGVIE